MTMKTNSLISGLIYSLLGVLSFSILTLSQNTTDVYASPGRPAGPYLTSTGSNYTDLASNSSLQLTKFSVAVWFRASNTSTPEDTESNRVIITKTGMGADTRGDNLNYGIWLAPSGRLRAGFEGLNGTDHYLQSTHMYNDSKWHFVALAYDGSALRLYIDGAQVRESMLPRQDAVPDNVGTRSLRIGANAFSDKDFFVGNIDEIRIWNRPLTNAEIGEGYTRGIFNTTGQVLYLPLG
jgi:Concanavalin A-like lectin/glucanases superfamily